MRPKTLGMTGQGHKVAGERNGMHKLNAEVVREVRTLHRRNGMSTYPIAEMFGVAESTIRRAVQRKTWRRVR